MKKEPVMVAALLEMLGCPAIGLLVLKKVLILHEIAHRSRQRRYSGVMAFAPRPEFYSLLPRASDHGGLASLFRGSRSLERSPALS